MITGYTDKDGYGIIKWNDKLLKAHRIALHLATGIPLNELNVVMHSCDNPGCVNPDHLSNGTHFNNIHDMMSKGRDNFNKNICVKGSHHPKAKIDEAIALAIYQSKGKLSIKQVQRQFGISRTCVCGIWYGHRWNHVTGLPMKVRTN